MALCKAREALGRCGVESSASDGACAPILSLVLRHVKCLLACFCDLLPTASISALTEE